MARARLGVGSYGAIATREILNTAKASRDPLAGITAPDEVLTWLRENMDVIMNLSVRLSKTGTRAAAASWQAETAYRGANGRKRKIRATGTSEDKAKAALRKKLQNVAELEHTGTELTPSSRVSELIDLFIEQMLADTARRRPQTMRKYQELIARSLRPGLGELRIGEFSVPAVNRYLTKLYEAGKHSDAKQSRSVLNEMARIAMGLGALTANPMPNVLRTPARTPRGIEEGVRVLTTDDIRRFRMGLLELENTTGRSGPKPDGQLRSIFELWIATGARPNEVLALRIRDINITTTHPYVTFTGTITTNADGKLIRQARGKTPSAYRQVPLAPAAVTAVRRRLDKLHSDVDPDSLVFSTRVGTPHSLKNLSRGLTRVKNAVGLDQFFTYQLRASAATHVAHAVSQEQAALLLGHTDGDTATLRNHYLGSSARIIDPTVAAVMAELVPDLDDQPA